MTERPLMPVFASKTYRAWPRSPEGGAAMYQSPAIALKERYATDAHLAGYYVPSVPRRLDKEAPGHLVDGAPLGVAMAFFFVDLDGPDHRAPPEWRAEMKGRVEHALAEHPGGFFYETRGGGRLVWRRAGLEVITNAVDAQTWKLTYWRTLLYLAPALRPGGGPRLRRLDPAVPRPPRHPRGGEPARAAAHVRGPRAFYPLRLRARGVRPSRSTWPRLAGWKRPTPPPWGRTA